MYVRLQDLTPLYYAALSDTHINDTHYNRTFIYNLSELQHKINVQIILLRFHSIYPLNNLT